MAREAICFTLALAMADTSAQRRDLEATSSRADCCLVILRTWDLQPIG